MNQNIYNLYIEMWDDIFVNFKNAGIPEGKYNVEIQEANLIIPIIKGIEIPYWMNRIYFKCPQMNSNSCFINDNSRLYTNRQDPTYSSKIIGTMSIDYIEPIYDSTMSEQFIISYQLLCSQQFQIDNTTGFQINANFLNDSRILGEFNNLNISYPKIDATEILENQTGIPNKDTNIQQNNNTEDQLIPINFNCWDTLLQINAVTRGQFIKNATRIFLNLKLKKIS